MRLRRGRLPGRAGVFRPGPPRAAVDHPRGPLNKDRHPGLGPSRRSGGPRSRTHGRIAHGSIADSGRLRRAPHGAPFGPDGGRRSFLCWPRSAPGCPSAPKARAQVHAEHHRDPLAAEGPSRRRANRPACALRARPLPHHLGPPLPDRGDPAEVRAEVTALMEARKAGRPGLHL